MDREGVYPHLVSHLVNYQGYTLQILAKPQRTLARGSVEKDLDELILEGGCIMKTTWIPGRAWSWDSSSVETLVKLAWFRDDIPSLLLLWYQDLPGIGRTNTVVKGCRAIPRPS